MKFCCLVFFLLFSLLCTFIQAEEPKTQDPGMKKHILFLMHVGEIEQSIEKYQEFCSISGTQDYEILQRLGLCLLKQGIEKPDTQSQLLALFGAGLSGSSSALEVLEKGLEQKELEPQLLSLYFISQVPDDSTEKLLLYALNSDFLPVRMEAAYLLAERKHPLAVGQIETLMKKLPFQFRPFFPQLFARTGTVEAIAILKQLMADSNPHVCSQAIISATRESRDDLLPLIRKCITHKNIAVQESSAYSLGVFKDSSRKSYLEQLTQRKVENIQLAAYKALYLLGDRTVVEKILSMAKKGNLFAIYALGELPGGENLLAKLMRSKNLQIRTNATVGLLRRKDKRCVKNLKELFITDTKDLAFQPKTSIGSSLSALKVVPSASNRLKDPLFDASLTLNYKEMFLRECLELPEKEFLKVAKLILSNQQNDLVPLLVSLLENLRSEKAVDLLKIYAKKTGAPLIRDYCHLALFRLREDVEDIYTWVSKQNSQEMIRLRSFLPRESRPDQKDYSLDAEEKSRLLVDIYLAIASRQDEKNINVILEAMKKGNPKNRFALAGILIRATE